MAPDDKRFLIFMSITMTSILIFVAISHTTNKYRQDHEYRMSQLKCEQSNAEHKGGE